MKQIVFTIARDKAGLKITTTSSLADHEDKDTRTFAVILISTMERLTAKYNAQGISVLFEVE